MLGCKVHARCMSVLHVRVCSEAIRAPAQLVNKWPAKTRMSHKVTTQEPCVQAVTKIQGTRSTMNQDLELQALAIAHVQTGQQNAICPHNQTYVVYPAQLDR